MAERRIAVLVGSLPLYNHHSRQTLVSLNVPVMHQPEAYIGNIATLFSPEGRLINTATEEFLQ
jgi:chromate reductase